MNFNPTDEQIEIRTHFLRDENLNIEAGAGTGKTSTLKLLANSKPNAKGLYIAYNKAIAEDAKASFPENVYCATAHSLAFREVGRKFSYRLNAPRMTGYVAAGLMGIMSDLDCGDGIVLSPAQQARLVMETVGRFCHSADNEVSSHHVPWITGLAVNNQDIVREVITPFARDAWYDLSSTRGKLKFEHDHYLKLWQLGMPTLNYDFILLDEAQDSNPVVADVVESQSGQLILVGDRSQAIYGWRGAQDAMQHFKGTKLFLSQSFRFGEAIAEEANKWLKLLDSPLNLKGFDQIPSEVGYVESPIAILCRTNAECVKQVMQGQLDGKRVALVGGGYEIERLAKASIDLMNGKKSDHPSLVAFRSWNELKLYVREDASGSDLRSFVKLIEENGAENVIRSMSSLTSEGNAELVVSTAHKSKGREWESVLIAPDFAQRDETEEKPGDTDCMLNYVSVTRAMKKLDRKGLAWVDKYMKGNE